MADAQSITILPLTAEAFADYGDVLNAKDAPDVMINQGLCGRHHDRAQMICDGGRLGVSVFDAVPRDLPYQLDLMERHPLGSQCFMPMTEHPFLVIVADDDNGKPGRPKAFMVPPHTGVNIHRNVWHGVLTPLFSPGLFTVIDRVEGDGNNLEEHWMSPPYIITG